MKKIILVYPNSELKGIPSFFRYPPLGILQLAAVLRMNNYQVDIFDANIENKDFGETINRIMESQSDFIGFSATTTIINIAYKIINYLKIEKKIKSKIIVGGIHATALPREILEKSKADFAVIGEGEETLIELLDSLSNNKEDLMKIKGIAYRTKAGEIMITERRELIKNIDSLPIPAYDMIDIKKYSSIFSKSNKFITYIRSRGCPFDCIFCSVKAMFNRKYRIQSPEKTINDLKFLKEKFGIKEVLFKDSEFIIDKSNCKRLFELMISEKLNLRWTCGARIDSIDEEIISLMKKSGCEVISFGIESGSQRISDIMKKQISVNLVREKINIVKKSGIKISVNFIIGNYLETIEDLKKTEELIDLIPYNFINVSFLTPFPGSELYNIYKEKFNKLQEINYCDMEELNFLSNNMTNQISSDYLINFRKKNI